MNALLGIRLTWRDDLESLAYMLIYLMQGSLPWQSTTRKSTTELLDIKMEITPSTLCKGLPAEFKVFLNYARSLEFKQKPDYQYLRDLFSCLHESDNSSGVDIEHDLLPIFDEPHPKPVKAPKRREQVPVPPTTRKSIPSVAKLQNLKNTLGCAHANRSVTHRWHRRIVVQTLRSDYLGSTVARRSAT